MTLTVLIIAIALSIALALWLARIVSAPLREAVNAASRVARGDLTGPIAACSSCETGRLMGALHRMQQTLQHTLARVQHGANAIAPASSQIAAGNQDLSARTEQQASSLEETATSMDALTKQLINTSVERIEAGGQLAGEAGNTMQQIAAGIFEVDTLMRQITSANEEQGSGIEQVNQAVAHMDTVTQQNAALVEEAAAAAAAMRDQSQVLAELAQGFKRRGGLEQPRHIVLQHNPNTFISVPPLDLMALPGLS